jgi:hypothetical protein
MKYMDTLCSVDEIVLDTLCLQVSVTMVTRVGEDVTLTGDAVLGLQA